MARYNIIAARPANASNHLNSEFKLYEFKDKTWNAVGWKSIDQVTNLMRLGHDVRTGKIVDKVMQSGAIVEVELRIARNGTVFKISEMPDS